MSVGRVLVTGASGFVGRHAVPALLARGFEVHGASRTRIDQPGATQHRVDLLDAGAVARVVDLVCPSHLLHLAWTVTPGAFWTTPENLDWVAASLHLYRAFAAAGGRRAVGVGSCAEYDWEYSTLDEATTPCRPATLYGVAKHALHQLLAKAAGQDGISLAWARLFFLYGPHEARARLVPDVTLSLLQGRPALCGDGLALRDFMHVVDAADALAAVLASDHPGPVNIASGECVPVRDMILGLAGIVGRPDLVQLGARRSPPGDPSVLAADVGTLAGLGFHPRHTRGTGLAETVAWWRARERAAGDS